MCLGGGGGVLSCLCLSEVVTGSDFLSTTLAGSRDEQAPYKSQHAFKTPTPLTSQAYGVVLNSDASVTISSWVNRTGHLRTKNVVTLTG